MVVHQRISQNFGEVDAGISLYQLLQEVFVRAIERDSIQGCTGNDMVPPPEFQK